MTIKDMMTSEDVAHTCQMLWVMLIHRPRPIERRRPRLPHTEVD